MSDQTAAGDKGPLNPGVAIQYVIHGAVRRDMDRLVEALSRPDVAGQAVTDYASEFLFQLHHHHTFEDAEIWPLMGQRLGGSFPALLERNAAEHAQVAGSVEAFAAQLDHIDDDPTTARAAAFRMREVVSGHLEHEEADVIPHIPEAFATEDVDRFQAEAAKENPPARFLPWALESAPEPVAAAFAAVLPPAVQQLLVTSWLPAWQTRVDALQPNAPQVVAAG